ncbi:hypothetical protein RDV89_16835 [Nocardioides zeae]|uniref:Uncharacterized protein n=1 Tax=Nocardioides imazamoxiresistens TaxID=3231893 RepID=A0ABU3PZS8_9ACTN|nr:hypothetical protein [Nocardioides zeae]MDT9594755.1 hypothetical protein [Nocardioides zeae]
MGWLHRLLGGSGREPERVEAELRSAVAPLPGVREVALTYRTDASGGAALKGYVALSSREDLPAVLGTVGQVLGRDGRRVAVYAVGRLPDGTVVDPRDLGLRPRPSGEELRTRFGPHAR